jgi:hypothetical protein
MSRFIPAAAGLLVLALLAACEGTKIRLQNPHPPGTPAYAYDEAFYGFKYNHNHIQRLGGSPIGQQVATMADILKNLEAMRDLLDEPFRTDLLPFIEAHRKIQENSIDRGGVNQGVFLALADLHRKVDEGFYPEKVKLKAAAPAAAAPAADTAAAPPRGGAVPATAVAAAWRKAHDEVAAAYPDRPADAAAAFGRAKDALGLLKAGASEDAAPQIQIYLNEYDRLAGLTANFSKVPEGQSVEGVKKALDAVAKGVAANLPK